MNFKAFKLSFLIALEICKRNKLYFIFGSILIIFLVVAQYKFNLLLQKNSLRMGAVGTYQEHDIPQDVTRLTSKGLVMADAAGRIKPSLAEGWEVNNDATEFKFRLKKDLKWADGTAIKAYDLDISIPNTEFAVLDESTIQFKLKEPYSPFPSLLTKALFKKDTLIGTGPYKISKIEKSKIFITKLTLTPLHQGLPTLFVRFYPNESVARTGFNMGEVQVLLGLSNQNLGLNNPQVLLKKETDYSKMVVILYDTKDALLSNRSVRQALSFAAPKIEGEELADGPFPSQVWSYNPNAKKYLSNPVEAKLALNRAKAQVPEDKLKGELVLTATPNLEAVAKKVEAEWKNLGFDVKLRIESGVSQNFQALLITQGLPQDPDQYFLWHSSQERTNLSKYSPVCCPASARVDKDLEDGRKLIKEEDRKEKYLDFQRTLLEDAPATFLYFPKHNILYLKKVESLLNKVLTL